MTAPLCPSFPHLDWFAADESGQQQAAVVCRACPVREACEAGARARGEEYGIWNARNAEMGWVEVEAPPEAVMVVAEPAAIRPVIAACPGSRALYNAGCRCLKCRAENTAYAQHYRHDGPAVTRGGTVEDMQIPLFEGVSA